MSSLAESIMTTTTYSALAFTTPSGSTNALVYALLLRAGEQLAPPPTPPTPPQPIDLKKKQVVEVQPPQSPSEDIPATKIQEHHNSNNNKPQKQSWWWYQTPEPFRFGMSGSLGTLCFYLLERIISQYLDQFSSSSSLPPIVQQNKDSVSFFASYVLQIVVQHLLHALLVYGLDTIDTKQKYLTTLTGQFGAYFASMIGSTILNTWLREKHGLTKDHAFATTLILFSFVNYFVIGWIVRNQSAGKGDVNNNSVVEKEQDHDQCIIKEEDEDEDEKEDEKNDDNLATTAPPTETTEGISRDDQRLKAQLEGSIPRGGWTRTTTTTTATATATATSRRTTSSLRQQIQMSTTKTTESIVRSFVLSIGERVKNPLLGDNQSASPHMKAS